jgi:CRP-like cAMP-binding protein
MVETVVERAILEHPFSKGMCPEHLRILGGCASLTQFEAGQIIFHEGQIANRFYLIQLGKVLLETRTKNGHVLTTLTIGGGEVLGWSWLFPPYYWHFDARAAEATRAVMFFGTHLRQQATQDHHFGFEIMRRFAAILVHRLEGSVQQLPRVEQASGMFEI